jgi:K+-sensing histidine kinase KdpD
MLDQSHLRLQSLIDRFLADVRLDTGLLSLQRIPVWEVLQDVEIGAAMLAQARGIQFAVTTVDATIVVEADRPVLAAELSNLLHNAIKFTLPATTVKLRASITAGRVLLEVEDECGGLLSGDAENSSLRPACSLTLPTPDGDEQIVGFLPVRDDGSLLAQTCTAPPPARSD